MKERRSTTLLGIYYKLEDIKLVADSAKFDNSAKESLGKLIRYVTGELEKDGAL